MKQEEKDLLLKDLCARLPYGVKVKTDNIHILRLGTHTRVGEYVTDVIEPCKPYLFPLSSMTEEQSKEFALLQTDVHISGFLFASDCSNMINWLNKNHFDYNCLIPKGLAVDCTDLNVY